MTPEQTVRDAEADFVALTLFDGEIGIAPGHTPLIGRLGYGEMRMAPDEKTVALLRRRRFCRGGRRRCLGAHPAGRPVEEIDDAAAEEQLRAALARRAASPEQAAAHNRAAAQARRRCAVARRRGQ